MADQTRPDDPTIPHTDRLFRRVRPNQVVHEPDGTLRPSSAVFKDAELSVNIESLMIAQLRPPEDTLTKYPGECLLSILVSQVRERGYAVVKDTDSPNDPAHGLVPGKKRDSFANAMRRQYRWIVPPLLG